MAQSRDLLRAFIVRPSALGDTLLLAPALHQMVGEVTLTLLGRRPGIDFLRPFAHTCLDYEGRGWHTLFLEKPSCRDLPIPQADKVISFASDPSGSISRGLKLCLEGVPVFSFPPFPSDGEKVHVASYLASCLREAGLPVDPEKAIKTATSRPLLGNGTARKSPRTPVFHPGSGSKKKNYPPEFWIDLIRDADSSPFSKSTVLIGPAEETLHHYFLNNLSVKKAETVFCPPSNELLSLLNRASVCVGHDSGITHLAALLGTPTIALFKNSDPVQWTPLGPDVTVMGSAASARSILSKINEKISMTE